MSGANFFAYARWHARDASFRAVTPMLLFIAIAGLPIWSVFGRSGIEAIRAPGELHQNVAQLYSQMMTLAMTLGALLVASGFVALDREKGHVRFLFSTPVVAWQFYLQRYLIGVAAFVACYSLVPLGFGWLVFPVPVAAVVASTALYAFLLGSLAMLAGAITRHDGGVVIGVTLVGSILQALVRTAEDGLPAWMFWLSKVLPPIDTADQLRTAWLTGTSYATSDLTLVLGWSLAMLVVGLFTIKRAPLVR